MLVGGGSWTSTETVGCASDIIISSSNVITDLSLELKASLRDNLLSARLLSEGDIFLRIQTAHLRRDSLNKRKWLKKSTRDSRECVLSLERDAGRDDTLRAFSDGIDALVPVRGLWLAFQVDQLPALRAQRCPEVSMHQRDWELVDFMTTCEIASHLNDYLWVLDRMRDC